jgi:hypothetical protein
VLGGPDLYVRPPPRRVAKGDEGACEDRHGISLRVWINRLYYLAEHAAVGGRFHRRPCGFGIPRIVFCLLSRPADGYPHAGITRPELREKALVLFVPPVSVACVFFVSECSVSLGYGGGYGLPVGTRVVKLACNLHQGCRAVYHAGLFEFRDFPPPDFKRLRAQHDGRLFAVVVFARFALGLFGVGEYPV